MSNSAWVKLDIRAIIEAVEGEILPSIYSTSSYSADVYIRPSNQGIAKISIVPPTIYTKKIYPTKDAYVDKNNSILNFGKTQSLILDNDRFKAYMSFSLKEIPESAIIEVAKLNLYKQNFTNSNSIKVYSTTNDYQEIGITYLNTPTKGEEVFTQTINNNTGYVVKDLLDYTNEWYTDSKSIDRAFALSSDKSEVIILDSNDGANRPYIEVQYYIQNQNIGINEVYGEIQPICIKNYEFDGEIFVESGTRETQLLSGEINIINKKSSIELDCEISVINTAYDEYDGEINIFLYDRFIGSDINSILPMISNTSSYDGEINIIQKKSQYDYDGEIIVQNNTSNSYDGDINIITKKSQYDYDGEIVVEYNDSLDYDGEINIIQKKSQYDYDGEIIIQLNDSTSYYGEINIITKKSQYDYDGELLPLLNSTVGYVGEIDVAPRTGELEYSGEILVQYNNSLEYDGETNIITNKTEYNYDGEILVEYNSSLDHKGEINIITQNIELDFRGEISINSISKILEYDGDINPSLLRYITLEGSIDVNTSGSGIINFSGEILIKRSDSGYVFIM